MKKVIATLVIFVFLLTINTYSSHSRVELNLNSWVGNYIYSESLPRNPISSLVPVIEYKIFIYEDKGETYAVFFNIGYQTFAHFYTKVVGNNQTINFLFEDYLGFNIFKNFSRGDLMLSFSLENNQLYTTWHQMQSETSITCKATGIYFEKIIEDRIRQKFIGFTESTEPFSSMERLEETESGGITGISQKVFRGHGMIILWKSLGKTPALQTFIAYMPVKISYS